MTDEEPASRSASETRTEADDDLDPPDTDRITVFVETPKGSRNKYELDHETGRLELDRTLHSAVYYPGDYGFALQTWGEDNDPLDALIILEEPTFPGCTIEARVVGIFWMSDEDGPDAKLISVPSSDPLWGEIRKLDDVPDHLLDEIAHFFSVYKDLEDKEVVVDGYGAREDALKELREARRRFMRLSPEDRPAMP